MLVPAVANWMGYLRYRSNDMNAYQLATGGSVVALWWPGPVFQLSMLLGFGQLGFFLLTSNSSCIGSIHDFRVAGQAGYTVQFGRG